MVIGIVARRLPGRCCFRTFVVFSSKLGCRTSFSRALWWLEIVHCAQGREYDDCIECSLFKAISSNFFIRMRNLLVPCNIADSLGFVRAGSASLKFAVLALEDIPMWPSMAKTINPLDECRLWFQ